MVVTCVRAGLNHAIIFYLGVPVLTSFGLWCAAFWD